MAKRSESRGGLPRRACALGLGLAALAAPAALAEAEFVGWPMSTYVEILGVVPALVLLGGLTFIISIDPYIRRRQRRTMLVVVALVFVLIAQNFLENRLCVGVPRIRLRTVVAICGYVVRPAILALFLYMVRPKGRYFAAWLMVVINAAVYLTALYSPVSFWINAKNHFKSGPLANTCLVVSAALLLWLFCLTAMEYRSVARREAWLPTLVVLTIMGSLVLDANVGATDQPISFLTLAVVASCVFFYIWLHFQFVREHERALQAEQRIQIMMSQIQPHFLFNTLNTIRALCDEDPPLAARATEQFSDYLRRNLAFLDRTELVPLEKELEHTRAYAAIEALRFPDIRVEYDIRDADFRVPALIIQPLVENAIRHGVRIRDDGRVTVSTRRVGDWHVITIRDNGVGFDVKAARSAPGTHIGLANVRSRVEQMCGGTMRIESSPGRGAAVTLRIPVRTKEGKTR